MKDWLDEIKWDKDGLVPAIAQDHKTGRVLMMAWMNREALSLTASEQRAIFGHVRVASCGERAKNRATCRSFMNCAWTVMQTSLS